MDLSRRPVEYANLRNKVLILENIRNNFTADRVMKINSTFVYTLLDDDDNDILFIDYEKLLFERPYEEVLQLSKLLVAEDMEAISSAKKRTGVLAAMSQDKQRALREELDSNPNASIDDIAFPEPSKDALDLMEEVKAIEDGNIGKGIMEIIAENPDMIKPFGQDVKDGKPVPMTVHKSEE